MCCFSSFTQGQQKNSFGLCVKKISVRNKKHVMKASCQLLIFCTNLKGKSEGASPGFSVFIQYFIKKELEFYIFCRSISYTIV